MTILRIKLHLLLMISAFAFANSRPQNEDVFHPEPSIHFTANGYFHPFFTLYPPPWQTHSNPYQYKTYQIIESTAPTINEAKNLVANKRKPAMTMPTRRPYYWEREWNYEDPENYLLDRYMNTINAERNKHLNQAHQGKPTTTTTMPSQQQQQHHEEKYEQQHGQYDADLSTVAHNKPDKLLLHFNSKFNGDHLIAFRNPQMIDAPVTNLILKPVAKSIAGSDGRAIANPQAKAILRKGYNTDIYFQPEAIAVAGPGGIAHAQSDLEVIDPKTPVKITLLPFYGGARGQTLQITETADGTISTQVLQGTLPPIAPSGQSNEFIHVVENPSLPNRQESEYGQNIKDIHRNAVNIIRLQETAKNKGLSEQEEAAYKEYMESLNKSAHNLAKIYEGDDEDIMIHNRAGLSGWFARKKAVKKETTNSNNNKDKKKEEEDKKKKLAEEEHKKKEAEKKKKEEEDKKKAEEDKKKKDEAAKKKDEDDKKKKAEEAKRKEEEKRKAEKATTNKPTEIVNAEKEELLLPNQDDETSVAEAKPVGLAVAGIGGVASSKPIATAVVGPGGLAIARPVGTAIAGVSPDQALVPIYAEGFVVPNKATTSKDRKPTHSTEYLNKIISKYHQV